MKLISCDVNAELDVKVPKAFAFLCLFIIYGVKDNTRQNLEMEKLAINKGRYQLQLSIRG